MEEALFCSYVTELLREAGHMTQPAPIYANQSIQTTLYIENERTVSFSQTDRETLSCVSHVSLVTQLQWDKAETVQLYAVTVHFSHRHRSQDIAETHRLLQRTWRNRHSIVFFQNDDMWAVSFADDTLSYVLSDWFPFAAEETEILDRLSIENMSLSNGTAYFQDFQYALAREYYKHPISRSEARFALLPKDYLLTKYKEDGDYLSESCVSPDEFHSLLKDRIFYYEYQYGDDYVAPCYTDAHQAETKRQIDEVIEQQTKAEALRQARSEMATCLVMVLRQVLEERQHIANEKAQQQARAEEMQQVAIALQKVIAKAQIEEAERHLQEAMARQIATAFQQIEVRAERIEASQQQARAEEIQQVAITLQKVIAKAQIEEAERPLKTEAIRQLAVALQQILDNIKRSEDLEQQARETSEKIVHMETIAYIGAILRHILEEQKRIERATRRAKEKAERKAKTEIATRLTYALHMVIAKEKIEEAKYQLQKAMAERTAWEYQQIAERAKRIAEEKRIAREAAEEKLYRSHKERIQRLQKQHARELNLVQTELRAITLRYAEIEKALTKLYIFQFSKKKKYLAEQESLQQKEKQLRLLLTRIEDNYQKQLSKEIDTHEQALVICRSSYT